MTRTKLSIIALQLALIILASVGMIALCQWADNPDYQGWTRP